jgi:prevent-host-death family protein
MKKASISILKSQLSQYLDSVKAGEEIVVTERGRPIARLSPLDRTHAPSGRAGQLVREGRMRAPTLGRATRGSPSSKTMDPAGRSVAAILEERSQGG